ncbi:RecX family transcriptional regulator [Photobacterium jeanii]|uniref:Regulatory protein RecX n=1 Tax=Photobacterium jeanii TaxID=858640 RepID=A0A178K794_9GAMM|nr:recombination regulator RecX [Photobacterium jeanii]OAN12604.1 RecX family transcriptional regulator [Photobacterium jeanii]PST86730.1 recombination regulator RecX [Photobacterium jeanii]
MTDESTPRKKRPLPPVKEAAVAYLSRRDHAEKELRQKLKRRGYSHGDIEQAIDFCQDYKWLDDVRYAGTTIRNGIAKGWGELRIRQEMELKGVNSQVIEQVMAVHEIDWFEHARAVAQRKYGETPMETQKEKAKRFRFMQSRGFDFEQIAYAFDQDEEY